MAGKLRHTALPFLVLLAAIIIAVTRADKVAERLSSEPIVVQLTSLGARSQAEQLWQFEDETPRLAQTDLAEDTLYTAAVTAYGNGQYRTAENYFATLLNLHPGRPELLNYLGLVALRSQDILVARDWMESALDADSAYVPAMINLGLLYTRLENFRKADSLYARAAELRPFQSKPHLNKGIMHCRIGEWEQARVALTEAASRASGTRKAKAVTYRGMAFFNLGDTAAARVDFQEATNLAPAYLLPRIYRALTTQAPEQRLAELDRVIALQPNYAPAHYYQGVVYQELQRPADAQASFERALQLNPGDRDISEMLGSFYIDNDLISQAETYFQQVYRQDTLSPQNFFYRAKIAARGADLESAIALYGQAIDRSGGNYAEAFLNQGILHKKQGRIDQAVAAYQQAIALRTGYEEAWYNMALAHRADGQDEQAARCYRQAIAINPAAHKARYNLAFVLKDLGREAEALAEWEAIIAQDPTYAKAWYNVGLTYLRQDDASQAARIYTQMLERFPGYTKAWYNLARAQSELGQTAEAITSYERALNLDPTYVAAWKNLGNLQAQNGNPAAATSHYQQAIDLDNSDAELRYNLALQLEKQGDVSEALVHLNKAVQLRPSYTRALRKWRTLAATSGNQEQALRARIFLEEQRQDPDSTYALARDLHKADRYTEAQDWYARAEAQGKQDKWVAYWSAKAHEEAGDNTAARSGYTRALDRDPNHKFSLYRMALLEANAGRMNNPYARKLKSLYPAFAAEKQIK